MRVTKSVRRKPKCWVEGLSAEGTRKGGGLSRVSLTVGIWCRRWSARALLDMLLQVVSLAEYAPTRRTVTSQATGLRIFNWKRRRQFNIPSRIQFLHQTYRFHSHSYAWWRIRLDLTLWERSKKFVCHWVLSETEWLVRHEFLLIEGNTRFSLADDISSNHSYKSKLQTALAPEPNIRFSPDNLHSMRNHLLYPPMWVSNFYPC